MRQPPRMPSANPPSVPGGLTAVLIARDEERDLPGALESLAGLADEIVVLVDESSADRTEAIAKEAGARAASRRFDNFASQKQAAVEMADGAWILSIDADERVTPKLREEILRVLPGAGESAGFDIPFATRFLGRSLRFGGLGSETHLRLFRRGRGRFTGGALHEGVAVDGPVKRLSGKIIHEPYRDLSDYIAKMQVYTTLAASQRHERGVRFRSRHHLLLPWEFFARAVLKLGFLDGGPGIIWAGLSAFHSWLKYLKLRELDERPINA